MEQQSSKPLALVLGLPLVAIALAVVFSSFMSGDDKPAPTVESAPTQFATPPEPIEPAPAPEPQAVQKPAPAPPTAAVPTPAPPPTLGARPEVDAAAQAEQYRTDPKLREHAQLMSTESAKLMMKQGNVEGLRHLRNALGDQRVAGVIPAIDLEAMDVGIDCMARASGFRQRADDYLDDNPSATLSESVRAVCK